MLTSEIISNDPIIPPKIPTSLYALGHDKIPIPTNALNVLVNDSAIVNLTMYFSDFLSLVILPSNVTSDSLLEEYSSDKFCLFGLLILKVGLSFL